MFFPGENDLVAFPPETPPMLLVVVDAEEEFDWDHFSSAEQSVTNLQHQARAQSVLDRYGIIPTYLVDYPVASQSMGYRPLLEFLQDGRCEIGTQLHPWVNPPTVEDVNPKNSFAGNLPAWLEREKLVRLTATIEKNFGVRPDTYRAGRYGTGPNTTEILFDLGYSIDLSVVPYTDFRSRHGPDYGACAATPYWFGPDRSLLEIPVTLGMLGALSRFGPFVFRYIRGMPFRAIRLTAILARMGLLDRILLTPEGISLDEAKRLTRALHRSGQRVFAVTYHSPSLEPGHTPYVRTSDDLQRFLDWIEGYLAFFFEEMRGRATTPHEVRNSALAMHARKPEAERLEMASSRPYSRI